MSRVAKMPIAVPAGTDVAINASSITVWVMSASTCCTNRHASSVFGAQPLPILSTVRHSLIMDVVSRQNSRESLTVRKQKATRARIASAAAQSVAENGLAGATVEQIAHEAGFGTGTTLRQHFARALGTTPHAYRRAFGGPAAEGTGDAG